MKSVLAFIMFAIAMRMNPAFALSFPMNGNYIVRASSIIGMGCRGMATKNLDSLGQSNLVLTVISDPSGLYFYNENNKLILSFLESEGYQYFDNNQTLARGREVIIMNGNSLVFEPIPRLSSDVGFGSRGCEFPRANN